MPILKYTLLVGASLLALIVVAGQVIEPVASTKQSSATTKQSSSSSSLELLRKMANHGENRPFASAAAAGPFLAMPAVTGLPVFAETKPVEVAKPVTIAVAVPPAALNAQARLAESDVSDKPSRPAKKVVNRKPKPRFAYVENVPRGPGSFFGAFQSW